MAKVSVLGGGSWGIALAVLLHKNGHHVTVWSALEQEIEMLRTNHEHKMLPGVKLPEDMIFTVSLEDAMKDKSHVDEFYRNEFQQVQSVCGYDAEAKTVVECARECGKRVILATNPLFPPAATESRMRWAGLAPEDFDFYTVYDNSTYCKPNLNYYHEILEKTGLKAEECLMVGNDVSEDMITETLGMKVFLLTDCLINKENVDISKYPHGSFAELKEYIKSL